MANWWLNSLAFLASLSLPIFAFVVANSDFCGVAFESQPNHALVGYGMKTTVVDDEFECQLKCVANDSCKSFNVHSSSSKANRRICELNNKTRQMKPKDFKPKKGSTYYGSVKVSCIDNGRQRHGQMSTARSGGHCHPGYAGKKCAVAIGSHPDHPAQSCKYIWDVGISNKNGWHWIDPKRIGNPLKVYCDLTTDGAKPFVSCKEIYNNHKSQGNKAYLLQMPSGKVPVYCHMSRHGLGACGGGGWTLVMKTDGTKPTFHFNSKLWSNRDDFNLPGGKTLFDNHETKLPTYWNTSFSKICLGMKIGDQTRFIVLSKRANSLYSLIADGNYRATSLGRNTWKSLIGSSASLQPKCNKEGFNCMYDGSNAGRARIGILSNNENDCATCDSRIGFGTGGLHDDSNTCGNEAIHGGDNGDQHIKAMGYILVQ